MRFSGNVAVVTGASSGIGQAVAQAFLNEGACVFAIGRDSQALQNLKSAHGHMLWCGVDLRLAQSAEEVVNKARDSYGRIDILVNAAGILSFGRCDTTTDADWRNTLELNLEVPFRLLRACVPSLKEARGSAVNVSSINSNRPFSNTLAYSVSKAGLDQLTRVAAVELAEYGVRINAVNPGVVRTEMHRRAGLSAVEYEKFVKRGEDTHPLGRIGTAEEVADAVLFLCEAQWITGVTLPIDGGRHLTVVR